MSVVTQNKLPRIGKLAAWLFVLVVLGYGYFYVMSTTTSGDDVLECSAIAKFVESSHSFPPSISVPGSPAFFCDADARGLLMRRFDHIRISNIEDYPGKAFLGVVADNRFSNSDMERFAWDHGHFPLPRNTAVSLIHVPSSPAVGTEKFILRFTKPRFFHADFVVEPLGATGMGVLPSGLTLTPELTSRCETYQFQVTMKATFEKLTAGNSQTQEYKDWANWLFSRVREDVGD